MGYYPVPAIPPSSAPTTSPLIRWILSSARHPSIFSAHYIAADPMGYYPVPAIPPSSAPTTSPLIRWDTIQCPPSLHLQCPLHRR
ncbi:hypothetical protein NDU88_008303 [Pleurodeles waltl]|uniref:Uncharacterized protein n=1 Tax=Pleurodeles waltl TaxID=8319 RepID=A0AAV7N8Q7_PLEWA|nr:hypothetical protein NDU88_008303 [Pleurodeles waltl]